MRLQNLVVASIYSISLLLTGCTTFQPSFNVNVDSISSEDSNKKSYVLLSGNESVRSNDLQFKEYASYINRALIKQGFIPAITPQNASLAIFLSYGIGAPQTHQYTYSVPVWGQTGVSSSYTTGTINSYGTYSGMTTYTPSYGVVGSTIETDSYVTYFRYFIMEAIDFDEFRKSEKQVQLWKTTVTSTGSSGDLRRVFPILVAASQQYIARNTEKEIEVSLHESDENVMEIKGLLDKKETK